MYAVTLRNPWPYAIAKGWKSEETRTHKRLRSLVGCRIAIHAGLGWDAFALAAMDPYLTPDQRTEMRGMSRADFPTGIVCTGFASGFRELTHQDSGEALFSIDALLYGLHLQDVYALPVPTPATGRQYTWQWPGAPLRLFGSRQVPEAIAYAEKANGQALHVWKPPTNVQGKSVWPGGATPMCFQNCKTWGHLIDADADRLVATAERFGVRRVIVGRRGTRSQHIDLCGKPLQRAIMAALRNLPEEEEQQKAANQTVA